MPSTLPTDPFVTKGIEYLWVILFLAAFVLYWRFLNARPAPGLTLSEAARAAGAWFKVALDRRYHPGHTWVQSELPGRLRLGLDDFAQRLLGPVDGVILPAAGTRLRRGSPLLTLSAGGQRFDLRSPVSGEVVRINPALASRPDLINDDPYDTGWIAEVRPRRLARERKGLLTPSAAARWMQSLEASLRLQLSPALGTVLQDGGTPVGGLARVMEPESWPQLIEEHLMARRVPAGPGSSHHENVK